MSTKSDKAEIVQSINAAVKSAGLPELPFDLLHKADAIALHLFYDRWLTVALGRIMGGPSTIRGRTRGEFGPIERQILPPEPKQAPTGMTGATGPKICELAGLPGSMVLKAYCRKCKDVVTFLIGALTVGDDGMVTCEECQGLCGRPPFVG